MWKQVQRVVLSNSHYQSARTFLSESYKCTDSWNARLSTPIISQIKLDPFYSDLEHKFQQQGKASAIDIDIFANKINDNAHMDELADLVHKLRLTEETSNSLDSTGHALVRNFLEHNNVKELLDILNDRLSYGVFLDSFTANLALDKLIKAKDFTSAARIATFVMLQEDFENKITSSISLYACMKYLQNPEPFIEPVSVVAETPTKGKKKKEEVRVRVHFLRNPFFDSHFDLIDQNQLVGKTLMMIGKGIKGTLGNSVQLLGLALYQQYEEAIRLLSSVGDSVHKDVLKIIQQQLSTIIEKEDNVQAKQFSENLSKLSGADGFEEAVCKLANDAVSKYEASDIDTQQKIYAEWCDLRQTKLNEEMERMNRAKRLAGIEKLTEEMINEEQKLWFFDNEDKIDLQIDSKKVTYPKRWFGKVKKPRVVDAGYVPPEIIRNRRN